jgi:hypothetical protein
MCQVLVSLCELSFKLVRFSSCPIILYLKAGQLHKYMGPNRWLRSGSHPIQVTMVLMARCSKWWLIRCGERWLIRCGERSVPSHSYSKNSQPCRAVLPGRIAIVAMIRGGQEPAMVGSCTYCGTSVLPVTVALVRRVHPLLTTVALSCACGLRTREP